MTIVEAFACGTPVVWSALGAMTEIVSHNGTGVLFEPCNAGMLAKAVKCLAVNQDRLSNMRHNARNEFLKCYTPGNNYGQLMEIYQAAKNEGTSCHSGTCSGQVL